MCYSLVPDYLSENTDSLSSSSVVKNAPRVETRPCRKKIEQMLAQEKIFKNKITILIHDTKSGQLECQNTCPSKKCF